MMPLIPSPGKPNMTSTPQSRRHSTNISPAVFFKRISLNISLKFFLLIQVHDQNDRDGDKEPHSLIWERLQKISVQYSHDHESTPYDKHGLSCARMNM